MGGFCRCIKAGSRERSPGCARAGLRALQFLRLPTDAQLDAAGALDCVGVAGAVRSMHPDAMRSELAPVAALFHRLGARVLHYKLCSTFDSAPAVGSIGVALQTLRAALPGARTAIVGGQPDLGRYCVFSNLFARAGSAGEVHRIDRHPTMSRHPVTRMGEADLAQQRADALSAWGLSYLAAVAPGVALCRLHSDNPALDGIEIALKGGQMGTPDLFERLVHGTDGTS